MGLSITGDTEDEYIEIFSGGYASFLRFRNDVAKLIGFKSYEMNAAEMTYEMTGMVLPGRGLTLTGIQKKKDQRSAWYRKFPSHRTFFLHSDCDGEWTVEELKDVQKIIKGAKNHCKSADFKSVLEKFLDGVEMCIDKGIKAVFH